MSDLLKDLPKLTQDGDIGAALLGVAIGFFGDSLIAVHVPGLGIPPGAASVYFGAAVLGAKRSIQAIVKAAVAKHRDKSAAGKPVGDSTGSVPERAWNLCRLMREAERVAAVSTLPGTFVRAREELELDLELFAERLIDTDELGRSVAVALSEFRDLRLGAGYSQRKRSLIDPSQSL